MNLMKEIIVNLKIAKIPDKDRWMDSKSGWNNLKNQDPENIAKLIINQLETSIIDNEEVIPNHKYEKKQNDGFTLVKLKDNDNKEIEPWRKEEALERIIVYSQIEAESSIKLVNQINVGKSKESIDLGVIDDADKLTEIIELKHDAGGGTPLFAVIEILKNYFLIKKTNSEDDPTRLVVLAPEDYYKDDFKCVEDNKDFEIFKEIIINLNKLLKKYNCKLYIKQLYFKRDILKNIFDYNQYKWESNSETERYSEKTETKIIVKNNPIFKTKEWDDLKHSKWDDLFVTD